MKKEIKGLIGLGLAGICGIGCILCGAYKAISDEKKNWSDEQREIMNMPIEEAEALIKHMWTLGEKYIEEHPEAEFRTND